MRWLQRAIPATPDFNVETREMLQPTEMSVFFATVHLPQQTEVSVYFATVHETP